MTFSTKDFEELRRIAETKKVSVAWVVRDAVDQYLHEQSPLLRPWRENSGRQV